MKRARLLRNKKGPCQGFSRDEHRIWAKNQFFKKGSDPTFKIAMSGATDPINHVNPFFWLFMQFWAKIQKIPQNLLNSC